MGKMSIAQNVTQNEGRQLHKILHKLTPRIFTQNDAGGLAQNANVSLAQNAKVSFAQKMQPTGDPQNDGNDQQS